MFHGGEEGFFLSMLAVIDRPSGSNQNTELGAPDNECEILWSTSVLPPPPPACDAGGHPGGHAAQRRPAEAQSIAKQRPNVLFIICDDLNHYVLHRNGSPSAKTPHIDRLAEQGVTFVNMHAVTPVCGPSRTLPLDRASIPSGMAISMSGSGIRSPC